MIRRTEVFGRSSVGDWLGARAARRTWCRDEEESFPSFRPWIKRYLQMEGSRRAASRPENQVSNLKEKTKAKYE